METVKQFITRAYRLINPSNPTQPLHGDDLQLGVIVFNQLIDSYAATGLFLTVAKTVSIPILTNQAEVTVGSPTVVPTPDIQEGRLASFENAWLTLTGVDYPLINETRSNYLSAWKYEPLKGLPRFIMTFPEIDVVRLRLYPAPSQEYQFSLRGKFQVTNVSPTDELIAFPAYRSRNLQLAIAKDMAIYKGRESAWTDKLEAAYIESLEPILASTEVNVSINGDKASMLNGAWRVRSGI